MHDPRQFYFCRKQFINATLHRMRHSLTERISKTILVYITYHTDNKVKKLHLTICLCSKETTFNSNFILKTV